ncbi:hypothetical protein BGZ94_006565 [Podila epigama]|nr:hypothetical protein BGZ94_006565 [Podila epigama]
MSTLHKRKPNKTKDMSTPTAHGGDAENSERPYSEHTPLLTRSSSDPELRDLRTPASRMNQGSWRRMAGVFLLMVVSYLVIGAVISYKRHALPEPLSVEEATGPNDFAGKWAWQHLEQIAQKPHPINSRENLRVRDYLVQTVRKLQDEAKALGRTVEVADDHVKLSMAKNILSNATRLEYYESSNILVRVVGTAGRAEGQSTGRPEALVVSAHFDSVLIGHGATDDGIGVTVILEMIRNLITHPVRHNVVFNINNGEEVGLYGAVAFMKHPWSKDVKAFVNLEGAGAGGRALLFRASNKALVSHYSKVGNSPHANVFGNDVFQLELIKSNTDFAVYTYNNVPGLDIAFYSRRAFYHTLHDDIEHTSPGSLQHMGNTALVPVRSIADSDYLTKPKGIISSEASVYYDIAGLFMLVYSFNTFLTLNYNLLIIVPVFIAWAIISAKKHGLTLGVVLRSYLAMLTSFVAAFATSIGFAAIINKVNPMLAYGEHWIAFLFFVFQSCTAIICVQWAWVKLEQELKGDFGPLELALERTRLDSEQVANVGMVLFWWTLLIGATIIARKLDVGMLYFISWFTFTSMIIAYLSVYPKRRGTAWTLGRLWINFFPLTMALDIAVTNMIAMSGTLVDGTPSLAIMGMFAICALNCVMPLIPTIHRSANFRKMGQVSLLLTASLFVAACFVFPYSAENAPNKLIWRQIYDLDHDTSTVTVRTAKNLDAVMAHIPEAQIRECGPDSTTKGALIQCVYKGGVPSLVTWSKTTGEEIIKSQVSKPEYHEDKDLFQDDDNTQSKALYRSVHVVWTAKDSRLCQVTFPTAEGKQSPIVKIQLAGFEEPEEGFRSGTVMSASRSGMSAFKREYNQTWDLEVVYKVANKDAPTVKGVLGCLYDEWDHQQIPAFTHMRNHLPKWALLGGGKGPGLLMIQKGIVV